MYHERHPACHLSCPVRKERKAVLLLGRGFRVGRQSCLRHTDAAPALLPWSTSIITVFLPVHYHAFVSQRFCKPAHPIALRQPQACIGHLSKKRGALLTSHRLPCPEFACCGFRTHGQHVRPDCPGPGCNPCPVLQPSELAQHSGATSRTPKAS